MWWLAIACIAALLVVSACALIAFIVTKGKLDEMRREQERDRRHIQMAVLDDPHGRSSSLSWEGWLDYMKSRVGDKQAPKDTPQSGVRPNTP